MDAVVSVIKRWARRLDHNAEAGDRGDDDDTPGVLTGETLTDGWDDRGDSDRQPDDDEAPTGRPGTWLQSVSTLPLP